MIYKFKPIGIIHSCFQEKFGIPRQGRLVPEARGTLEILPPYNCKEAFRGLEGFSHLLITFVFHDNQCSEEWRPTVRPPRLGGNERVGVFASRSPFRPNPLGISVVELESVDGEKGKLSLSLKGIDLLDKTPVLDIKPYLPYADCVPEARAGYAMKMPATELHVTFDQQALIDCEHWEKQGYPELRALITRLLSLDPRPAYYIGAANRRREFGMKLLDFDVKWKVVDECIVVIEIRPLQE